jgi:hypothetical protein
MRRTALALIVLALLAASCGDDTFGTAGPRDATSSTGPEVASLGADNSGTSGGETTTTLEEPTTTTEATTTTETTTTTEATTTTVAPDPCPLPQPLPRGGTFDEALVRMHRATTAFAEGALRLGEAIEAAPGFRAGWGAREPVASALYRMQSALYTLAFRLEQTYAEAGATYSPGTGWTFPDPSYPLAALAAAWEEIPAFQAVTLTGLFGENSRRDARSYFRGGAVCALVAAFSAAMDEAVAASG